MQEANKHKFAYSSRIIIGSLNVICAIINGYMSQPPATRIIAQSVIQLRVDPRTVGGRAEPHHHFFSVEDPAGVKMSQVAEKVLSIAREYGGGIEDLADLRLNNWRLKFPHHVDVAGKVDLRV